MTTPTDDQYDAFESAVSRLPYPVFVVDGAAQLRAMNPDAGQLWKDERLDEDLIGKSPRHPLSRIVKRIRSAESGEEEEFVLELGSGKRFEVIHSLRSPRGEGRWLILMLRPFPTANSVDPEGLRRRWSLTRREAEVAAACISGRRTTEICASLAISRETFKTHMSRLLSKAGCENRTQMIAKYLFGE